jgi:hypothetical protein
MIKSLIDSPIKTLYIMTWVSWIFHYNVRIVNLKFFNSFYPLLKLRVAWVIKWKIILMGYIILDKSFVLWNWVISENYIQKSVIFYLIIFEFLIWFISHIIIILERLSNKFFDRRNRKKSFFSVKIIIHRDIFRILIQ